MRVNIYHEEFPDHVLFTEPRLDAQKRSHTGVRFYLHHPYSREAGEPKADHASGVTFWLRDTLDKAENSDMEKFLTLLIRAVVLLEDKLREQK